MKKIFKNSNMWFIASFFSFLTWFLNKENTFWLIFGFASITFAFTSRKKEKNKVK